MSAETVTTETEGNLEATSVARLLAEAWRDRRSGQLVLSRENAESRIQMTSGAPTAIESEPSQDLFAQFLEESKTLDAGDRLAVEKFAGEHACSQARAVLSLELLDAKTLYQKLRESTRSEMAALLEWRHGEFVWEAEASELKPGKPFDVLKLIQEELPKRWALDRLFDDLLAHSARVCEIVPNVRRIAMQLAQTGPMAERILQGFDGSSSIGQMLGEAAGDATAASTLWVLIHSGMLRTADPTSESTRSVLEIEVVVDESVQRAPSALTTGRCPQDQNRGVSTRASADGSKAESIRAEVARLFGQLEELSHYEVLGLANDANAAQIKKAYFKAAKKFHPDALGQLELDDIEADAGKVFARIATAFETLSNSDKRSAYDRGDVEATSIDTAQLAQAETAFRKGEILLRMGNFAGAIEYVERAVKLWPQESAYQAALGWALFKQPKSDPERAREHLAMAHDQAAEDALILFRLGLVLRGMGEQERSDECIGRARRLDPSVSD